jgi:hypothetical protein
MRLWIDDVREPPDPERWVWAKTSEEALTIIRNGGVAFISFDHDLDGSDTTYPVANYIERQAQAGVQPPGWAIHSQNPVGRVNLRAALESAERFWRDYIKSRAA